MQRLTTYALSATLLMSSASFAGDMGAVVTSPFDGTWINLSAGAIEFLGNRSGFFTIDGPRINPIHRDFSNYESSTGVQVGGEIGFGHVYTNYHNAYLGGKAFVTYTPDITTNSYGETIPFVLRDTSLVVGQAGLAVNTRSDFASPIFGLNLELGQAVSENLLAYVTGGVNWAQIRHLVIDDANISHVAAGYDRFLNINKFGKYRTGGNVGVGIKFSPSTNWLLTAQATYLYLGNTTVTGFGATTAGLSIVQQHSETYRSQAVSSMFGVSYIWN